MLCLRRCPTSCPTAVVPRGSMSHIVRRGTLSVMPRKKLYASQAERQRAYRERKAARSEQLRRVTVVVPEEQLRAWKIAASLDGLSLSEWVRRRLDAAQQARWRELESVVRRAD
jgi:predicted DNA binding CopG/RHH family protein